MKAHDHITIETSNLPTELQTLIDAVITGHVDFPGRDTQWSTIEKALSQGKYSLATILLNGFCKQQNAQRSDMPAELQALVEAAITGHVDFPGRDTQWSTIEKALSQGKHSLATILLNGFCKQQNAQRSDMPAELQALVEAAITGHVDFPGRDTQWSTIEKALSQGKHSLATILLNGFCKQQNAQRSDMPAELQALVEAAITGHVDFPGRDTQWSIIEKALSQGKHSLATILLNKFCKQQNALRSDMPAELQALVEAAITGHVGFPGRDTQWSIIEKALSQGKHSLATILLNAICKQQDNLRNNNQY